MALTGIGAGAAEGLETLLARHRAEEILSRQQQALAETTRSNQAQEGLRSRGLDIDQAQTEAMFGLREQAMQGQQQQQMLAEQNRRRDDARAQIALMPMGTELPPERMQEFVSQGAVGPELFEQTAVMEGDDASEPRPIVRFKGTAQQQHQAETERQRAETDNRREREFGERMERQDREIRRRESYGPPLVPVFDPDSPTRTSLVPRSQAGSAPGPEPAGMRTQITQSRSLSNLLEDANEYFEAGAKEMVGPAEGRLRVWGQGVPGVPVDQVFTDFETANQAVVNEIMRLRSGAVITPSEASRLLRELPTPSDKPEVWKARYRRAQTSLRSLEETIRQRSSGVSAGAAPGAAPGATPSPAGNPPARTIRSGRFEIEVEP